MARQGTEPDIPRKFGIEGGVNEQKSSTLVAGPGTVGSYNQVVLHADRDPKSEVTNPPIRAISLHEIAIAVVPAFGHCLEYVEQY